MIHHIEAPSLFSEKIIALLYYFRVIVPVREEIAENSEDYQAFLAEMAHQEMEKKERVYVGNKANMVQFLADL